MRAGERAGRQAGRCIKSDFEYSLVVNFNQCNEEAALLILHREKVAQNNSFLSTFACFKEQAVACNG